MISIEYKDEIFNIEPDACYKILRTWTVIDQKRMIRSSVRATEDGQPFR
ncbi:MAG: hypothetical protein U0T81_18385 [Saprospiraceae bacterium]